MHAWQGAEEIGKFFDIVCVAGGLLQGIKEAAFGIIVHLRK